MKDITVSDEDHEKLINLASQLNISLGELMHGFAGVANSRTSRETLKALLEVQSDGSSWYVLRQTA